MKCKNKFQIINKYRIISFDVFDTLVDRDVNHYSDVFVIVEKILLNRFGDGFSGFSQKRIDAEKKARECFNREITLDDIYDNLEFSDSDEIKKIEIETEFALSHPNEEMMELFNYCVDNNKTVIITSDMYLDKEVIEKLLIRNGYKGFDRVFVSSMYGVKKRDGKLFRVVLDEMGASSADILHIGNSFRSDYICARLNGINSIRVKKYNYASYISKNNILYSFINNRVQNIEDKDVRNGYLVYGPLLMGFLTWCNKELEQKNINNVYFASRDCFIIKKAFEYLYPEYNCTYMKVSRRAVQVPTINLNGEGFDIFLNIASFDAIASATSIYKRIGIEEIPDIKIDIKQADIKKFCEKDAYVLAKKDQLFEQSKNERIAMKNYLHDINFDGNVAFVDVGWKCSTQKALEYISNAEITGLYFGIHPVVSDISGKGYLFDRDYSDNFYTIMGGMSLIEAFFTSQEHSLRKYFMDNNEVDFEYENSTIMDKNSVVFKMQSGALQFIEDYKKSVLYKTTNISKECAFDTLKSIMSSPTIKNIANFGSILMENEGKIAPIINKDMPHGIKRILKDYGKSGWKIGFLKNILKINLPYKHLFIISYRLFKRK